MPDDAHKVDLKEVSKLIAGEAIGAERQATIYKIAHELKLVPKDPIFALLVMLESYSHLFSAVPDKMAAAAHDAASDVGAAARETTRQVIAETVTETVDQRAFGRRFRAWALGTVVGTMLITGGFNYATFRLMETNTAAAEQLYREEVAKAEAEIEATKRSVVQASTEAATRAGLAAAQATAKAYEDRLAADLKNSVDQRVADGLKLGHDKATLLGALIGLENQHPGTLNDLNSLASAGWQALVRANPTGPCPAQGYDAAQQRKTCTLWMP